MSLQDEVLAILIEECGASDDGLMAEQFASSFPKCREFRFIGALGFGGKVWCQSTRGDDSASRRVYVTCYPEDETPERLLMIARANQRLALLDTGRMS